MPEHDVPPGNRGPKLVLVTPEAVAAAITDVLESLASAGRLTLDAPVVPRVERPRNPDHGDYTTNVAMVLAKSAGMPPRDLAGLVAAELAEVPGVSGVEIAGPGFINLRLEAAAAGQLARDVVEDGADYGDVTDLEGQAINVEFISANPTGPIHLGHARWAAVGDALARVLVRAGAEVVKEFYINDRGVQMDNFGRSLQAAATGAAIPEDGYQGDYITDVAQEIVQSEPGILQLPADEQLAAFREAGYQLQLAEQKESLHRFRTDMDVWRSERELHESGAVASAFDRFRELDHFYEADGAQWLRTTEFGDDKDRVLVKADGEMTYFASDTAYYFDKRARGFDICIYLLGADHHGYVNRLRAVAACSGDDADRNIEVLIGQLVRITRGGREVRLSKRAGNIVTISDLVDEVGVDAARYSLIRYPVDSPLTLDLDLLEKRTNDNPVFYVQYAHARIASVLRNAHDLGIDWRAREFEPGLLTHEREAILLGALAEFPRVMSTAAELREPHRIPRYLEALATDYHKFYDSCRVLPRADNEPTPLNVARLWLCAAARQVLENGLEVCGVSAPDRM